MSLKAKESFCGHFYPIVSEESNFLSFYGMVCTTEIWQGCVLSFAFIWSGNVNFCK